MPYHAWFDSAMEPLAQITGVIFIIIAYGFVGLAALALIAGAIMGAAACVESELVHAWMSWLRERCRRNAEEEARDVEMAWSACEGGLRGQSEELGLGGGG
jgi:hypothetical protein